jgi:hypothetical protein
MKVSLLKEDAEKIVNYLASRPWGEVNQLLVLLAQAELVKEEVKEEVKS